ncbi:MAG: HAD-IA family hydrolase [Myxococcales bacterium]|jgi:HAD superfamily hydrolase (TIGR01509 family)
MDLHHVGLAVSDLFAKELFYRKVLGFSTSYRYRSRNTPGLRTVFLERGSSRLELLQREGAAPPASPAHLAFEVADVDAEHERLKQLGVAAQSAPRETGDGLRELVLRDPEGNRIELCARVRPAPRARLRAAIFDLDGTLVDSEESYYEADRLLLAERGVTLSREVKTQYVGRSNDEVLAAFRERFGLSDPVETLVARKNELYLEIARRHTTVFPKMARFAERLRSLGLPLAVASGSSPGVLETILDRTGLGSLFSVALSSEGGPSKPAPDIFLDAARRLGVEPDEALVVEDTQYGVEAAKRAFMACIAVPFQTPPPLPDAFLMADLLFPGGMAEFDVEVATRFVSERMSPAQPGPGPAG